MKICPWKYVLIIKRARLVMKVFLFHDREQETDNTVSIVILALTFVLSFGFPWSFKIISESVPGI